MVPTAVRAVRNSSVSWCRSGFFQATHQEQERRVVAREVREGRGLGHGGFIAKDVLPDGIDAVAAADGEDTGQVPALQALGGQVGAIGAQQGGQVGACGMAADEDATGVAAEGRHRQAGPGHGPGHVLDVAGMPHLGEQAVADGGHSGPVMGQHDTEVVPTERSPRW